MADLIEEIIDVTECTREFAENFDEALAHKIDDFICNQKITLGQANATMLCVIANVIVQHLIEEGKDQEMCRFTSLIYSNYLMGCFHSAYENTVREKGLH
jgi:hypothetical protein